MAVSEPLTALAHMQRILRLEMELGWTHRIKAGRQGISWIGSKKAGNWNRMRIRSFVFGALRKTAMESSIMELSNSKKLCRFLEAAGTEVVA
jgi:hypothetical protein